jgi:hypothetical protein
VAWICLSTITRSSHYRLSHMLRQSMVAVGFPAALTALKLPRTHIPKRRHKCCSLVCTLPVVAFWKVAPCHPIQQPTSCCRLHLAMLFCRPVLQHGCMWSLIHRYPSLSRALVTLKCFLMQGDVSDCHCLPDPLTDTRQHVDEWRFVDCTQSQCDVGCSWSSSQHSVQCLSRRAYSFLKHLELCLYGRGTLCHVFSGIIIYTLITRW